MDISEFRAGQYRQQFQYKSFTPTTIDHQWTWSDPRIHTLLEEANLRLGELNAFSLYVPDIDIFIRMHVVKEAAQSSRIEGTQTGVEDALRKKGDIAPEQRDDWQEVQNYIAAMNQAIASLAKLPLSTRLIKAAHKRLMEGVRGRSKGPGEFRRSQNWVGGATIKDAVFIPPSHDEVPELMGDLEKFLHNDTIEIPHLIRIAIAHCQFETIHPFLDGNGRIGRLMIALYLVSSGRLAKPTLYLSDYLEQHKDLYYDNLMAVRGSDNIAQWIKFFLSGVIETANKGIATFSAILKLKELIETQKLVHLGKKLARGRLLMNQLYKWPRVSSAGIQKMLSVSPATANGLISDFVRFGILEETTGQKRNRAFVFREYLNLFVKDR